MAEIFNCDERQRISTTSQKINFSSSPSCNAASHVMMKNDPSYRSLGFSPTTTASREEFSVDFSSSAANLQPLKIKSVCDLVRICVRVALRLGLLLNLN